MQIHVLPTRAGTDMLEDALRSPDGNPLATYGVRQMAGGSKRRLFDSLKSAGYFDNSNIITTLGKHAFLLSAAKQRIDAGFKTVKRMIHYPADVNDETVRCFTCGQIDEQGYHKDYICQAARDCIYDKQ